METRMQGSSNQTVSLTTAEGPEDPGTFVTGDTTPCGACRYEITAKLLSGICSRGYASYPVTDLRLALLGEGGRVLAEVKNLMFIEATQGRASRSGKAGDIITQSIADAPIKGIVAARLSWTNAHGASLEAQIAATP